MDTLFGLFFLLDEVVNQIDQERVYQVNEESTPVSDLDNIIDSLFGRNLIDVFDPQLEPVPQKPASPEQFSPIPPPQTGSCSICLEDWCKSDTVHELPCGHPYHSHCLAKWLEQDYRCPVCRYELDRQSSTDSHVSETSTPTQPRGQSHYPVESPPIQGIDIRIPWNLNMDLDGAGEEVLLEQNQRLDLITDDSQPGTRRSMRVLRNYLVEYRRSWLDNMSTRDLLSLARNRYIDDRVYSGMDHRELVRLVESTQGGAHLASRSVTDLLLMCRDAHIPRHRHHCLEKTDLIQVLLNHSCT
jgi:hypothetical protein